LEVLKNELKTVDNLVDLNILWSRWQEKLKNEKYYALIEKLAELIEEKEKRRVSLEILLSQGYRTIRNKIDHEGFRWKPTENESKTITIHLLRLANELWPRK